VLYGVFRGDQAELCEACLKELVCEVFGGGGGGFQGLVAGEVGFGCWGEGRRANHYLKFKLLL
jgi:hypothetical protein